MTTQLYSSHQQTRQQLDDLDALLQRMLALPQSGSDREPPEPVNAESYAPLPPSLPQVHVAPRPVPSEHIVQAWRLATPLPPEPPMAIPVDAPPEPAAYAPPTAPYPYSLVFGQPLPAEAAPMPLVENYVSPPLAGSTSPPIWAIPVKQTGDSSSSFFSLPFVAVNRGFDLATYLMGPLGGWLREPAGRNTLGWLGVIMILGALGWGAADWFGKGWSR